MSYPDACGSEEPPLSVYPYISLLSSAHKCLCATVRTQLPAVLLVCLLSRVESHELSTQNWVVYEKENKVL